MAPNPSTPDAEATRLRSQIPDRDAELLQWARRYDEAVQPLQQRNAVLAQRVKTLEEALRAVLPFAAHHEHACRGDDEWDDGCKIAPFTNRFGVTYGEALAPQPCTCGASDATEQARRALADPTP
jgi:hypothetical protein